MAINKKIYLRLIGGLGNQLFCYSYARSLAEKTGRDLVIDSFTGFIKDSYNRKSRVKSFLIKYKTASIFDNVKFYLFKLFPNIGKQFFNYFYLKEVDPRIFQPFEIKDEINKNILFIEGNFQSYLYFNNHSEIIKNEINLNIKTNHKITEISNKITNCNSVSIHLRRIDYDSKLNIQYYLDAIKIIKNKIKIPHFFIFSDDIQWCKKNFTFLEQKTFITHDSKDEVVDLLLMTQCKHFIIANSTFSWWGAWLANFDNKTIIAPKSIQIGVINSFYPSSWIII